MFCVGGRLEESCFLFLCVVGWGGLFNFIVSRVGVDLFRCFVEAFGWGRTCLVNSCPTEEMLLFWIMKGKNSNMFAYIFKISVMFFWTV